MCGEKQKTPPWGVEKGGSPPRVRGKVYLLCSSFHPPGITPACAGKRRRTISRQHESEDHPRVCGEKLRIFAYPDIVMGSPPRVRGKVVLRVALCIGVGITPACAGKRDSAPCDRLFRKDHPRVCGEKSLGSSLAFQVLGSPPRVRGKVRQIRSSAAMGGITPACAGKSMSYVPNSTMRRDHPRVCGEKSFVHIYVLCSKGSPPRVRGKVQCGLKYLILPRITPACAGKRPSCKQSACRFRDHPRVCGEKAVLT